MTKSERKAVAETLRRAAEIVADSGGFWNVQYDGACHAIHRAPHDYESRCAAGHAFRKIIGSTRGHAYAFWWPRDEAHRPVRVIALLLAADVVESGDWE